MRRLLGEVYAIDLESRHTAVAFLGDSPNDEPMFGFFPLSVAVANIAPFLAQLTVRPAYVTAGETGAGFVEFADMS